MKNRIVFVSPDEKLAGMVARVVAREEKSGPAVVLCGSMNEGLRLAREAVDAGAGLIVSRGGTGALIEQELNVPVMYLETSSYDVLRSLERAVTISRNIAVVGFSDLINSYNKVARLVEHILQAHIVTRQIDVGVDLEALMRSLREEGADVFIGGHTVCMTVQRLGAPYVLIETTEETVVDTLQRARSFLDLRQKEKEQLETLNSIIDFSYDGILAINRKGIITVFNPVIQKLTGLSPAQALGRLADEVVENSRMSRVIKTGVAELGELQKIGDTNIVTNRVPIVVDGEVTGVVATFQDVEKFQSMEASVRKKLQSKGHVAKNRFEDIIGSSPALKNAVTQARLYAHVSSTVLLFGESGTGKELFAQSIHNESERRDKPFVAVNCAALPESLLESTLFGYVEGAFTGARKGGSPGLFEMAHTGTIFLDEISEMQLNLQALLLRVLQEKEVTRIGGDNVIPVDVRIIAATNRDLYSLVAQGRFREDLYYRLCVLALNIPPLRERAADIPELVRYHMERKAWETRIPARGITDEALELLSGNDWPGNVRQLENVVERCVVLSRGGMITADVVRAAVARPSTTAASHAAAPTAGPSSLRGLESETIRKVLAECGGNRTRAAERLGISPSTLWRKLKKQESEETT